VGLVWRCLWSVVGLKRHNVTWLAASMEKQRGCEDRVVPSILVPVTDLDHTAVDIHKLPDMLYLCLSLVR